VALEGIDEINAGADELLGVAAATAACSRVAGTSKPAIRPSKSHATIWSTAGQAWTTPVRSRT
jgi:hypothetical protein